VLLFIVLAPLGFAVQQLTGFMPETGADIWRVLLINFSLPVWLYFIVFESSTRAATPGKRLVGLRVKLQPEATPTWPRIVLRTAIKLIPWELAHIASFALAPADGSFTMLQAGLLTLAWLLMLMYLFVVWRSRGGQGLHDRLAGTQIVAIETIR
ncbi:MAG: RDD family protein, partial [Pseudomonadota bacterium]